MSKKMFVVPSGKTDFLVMQIATPGFISLKTGKTHKSGMVIYTGKELVPNDLLVKAKSSIPHLRLEDAAYTLELAKNHKISYVFHHDPTNTDKLIRVQKGD